MSGARLRVLISAYACEPGRGSEPEVGWRWALEMAQRHDVIVLTRANNRVVIEAEIAKGGGPWPRFVYHDLPGWALRLKRALPAMQWYFSAWQRSARAVVAQLVRAEKFDVLHHVTFAGFRYPTALWGHGIPMIWGPIGGGEAIPAALLPWRHPAPLAEELARNFANATALGPLRRRAAQSRLVLASTCETQSLLRRVGCEAPLLPAIALDLPPEPVRTPLVGPLRLLYVGNFLALKGLDLALEAIAQTQAAVHFTLIGSGAFEPALRAAAARLGLGDRVEFRPRMPRVELLAAFREFDVFLFPSLHDSGGVAALEAMANLLPIICLDCGGPALSVAEGCGLRVPLASRREVVAGLQRAIETYAATPTLAAAHGENARRAVAARYSWAQRAEAMEAHYREALR